MKKDSENDKFTRVCNKLANALLISGGFSLVASGLFGFRGSGHLLEQFIAALIGLAIYIVIDILVYYKK